MEHADTFCADLVIGQLLEKRALIGMDHGGFAMKKTGIALAILMLMIMMVMPVAAGPDLAPTASATATVTTTATTAPTFTPQATYTPLPTYTPQPTYTPMPTFTPLATSSPLPTPTALPTVAPTATPIAVPTIETQPGLEFGGRGEGKLIFGGSYTLRSGDTLRGDLVIFGGTAVVEADSRVNGNVVVIGGSADIAGHVNQDLVLIGGASELRSSAVVDGQLVRVGGALRTEEGAQIRGGESGGAPIPPIPPIPPVPSVPTPPVPPVGRLVNSGVNTWINFVWHVARTIGTTILLTLLAAFAVALWPNPMQRVDRTIKSNLGMSWIVGVLTPLVFAVVIPAFAILSALLIIACGLGLVGFMLIALASLALAVAWLMGWIALGQIVGDWLLRSLGTRDATSTVSAAVGTAAITLLWLGLDSLSSFGWLCGLGCLGGFGWVIFVLVAPIGLGAVVLTRFGTQDYNGTMGYMPHAPTPPTPPVAPLARSAPSAPEGPEPFAPVEPPAPVTSPEATPSSEPSTSPAQEPPADSPLDKPVGEV
jgi:hypothetical protein